MNDSFCAELQGWLSEYEQPASEANFIHGYVFLLYYVPECTHTPTHTNTHSHTTPKIYICTNRQPQVHAQRHARVSLVLKDFHNLFIPAMTTGARMNANSSNTDTHTHTYTHTFITVTLMADKEHGENDNMPLSKWTVKIEHVNGRIFFWLIVTCCYQQPPTL